MELLIFALLFTGGLFFCTALFVDLKLSAFSKIIDAIQMLANVEKKASTKKEISMNSKSVILCCIQRNCAHSCRSCVTLTGKRLRSQLIQP